MLKFPFSIFFLAEAKQEFNGNCSVQVYSVQACIPKDPAALWNAEFVQAEELFKQSFTVDNCLRDNRYDALLQSVPVSYKKLICVDHGVARYDYYFIYEVHTKLLLMHLP